MSQESCDGDTMSRELTQSLRREYGECSELSLGLDARVVADSVREPVYLQLGFHAHQCQARKLGLHGFVNSWFVTLLRSV